MSILGCNMELYKLSEEYRQVLQGLSEIEDLDEQTIADTLAPYESDLEQKCLSVAAFIKNLLAEAEAVKNAENAMKARRTALENKAKRLKSYLAANLPHKLKNDQLTVSPLKGRSSVVVDNIDLLPESMIKVERKAVLTEVKKGLADLPEGAAHEVVGAPSVTIK